MPLRTELALPSSKGSGDSAKSAARCMTKLADCRIGFTSLAETVLRDARGDDWRMRSRVSHFMNKFRELGFIDYNGSIEVHSSLLSVVLPINRR
jgi:hypothetical protein